MPEVVRRRRRQRAKQRFLDALEARGDAPLHEAVRREVQSLAERWARKGFDAAFPDADEFEVRCVEEGEARQAAAAGDETKRWQAAERAHRRSIVQAYGSIEIRGLQLSERVHQELEIAYVPLSVEGPFEPPPRATTAAPRRLVAKATKGKKVSKSAKGAAQATDATLITAMLHKVTRPRLSIPEALIRYPRMLLVGAPGSGKSTVIAYLATCAAKGELGLKSAASHAPIPFVLPVRSVPEPPASLEALARAVGDDTGLLERALRAGRALLLVDGLDEARREVVGELLPTLGRHVALHPDNRLLATSRPAGLPEAGAASLEGLTQVRLLPMSSQEVGTFIERWCLAAELSLKKAKDQAEAAAKVAAEDLKTRVRRSGAIEKLAETPLLCSVVCVVHRFLGHNIPERRAALYDVITNVLLYEWDRSKFPAGSALGKLDAHAKRALLGLLARTMHEARVAEVSESEALLLFRAHLPTLGHDASEAASLIAEIRDRNGVLVERSPGVLAFSHLTFQEYLTAVEMARAHAYDVLVANHEDPWWHEVIALAAGLPGTEATTLIDRLLAADGDAIGAGTMLAAQCAETAVILPVAQRATIEGRIRQLVPPRRAEDEARLLALRDVAGPVLLRELERADVNGQASIVDMLGEIRYSPAISAIVKHLNDSRRTTRAAVRPRLIAANVELSFFAAIATVQIAMRWEHTLPVILSALPNATASAVRVFGAMKHEKGEMGRVAKILYQHCEPLRVKSTASSPGPRKRAARSG